MKSDLRLYILMRNDLQSMVPGRCMAQASHASNAVVHEHGAKRRVVGEWQKQTKQGFGTTIVLSANKDQIEKILADPELKDWVKGWVTDPEYVIRVTREVALLMHQNYDAKFCNFQFNYDLADETTTAVVRSEQTCAYILGTKEKLFPILGDLPLY
jgi:peptidyl-tRNA hydrolase